MPSSEALVAASGGSIHEHRKRTRKMRWWYESLADFMIANPRATQNDMAGHFQRGVNTISTIINTDAFKAYYRQRRAQIHSDLSESVKGKLLNIADQSMDALLEKLEKKRDTLPIESLHKTAEMALKSLGYGGDKGPTIINNVNQPTHVTAAVSLEDLQVAQAALRRAQSDQLEAPKIIDVTPSEVEANPLDDLV